MSLVRFNTNGDSFVQLTSDNRLALWDTTSGVCQQQFFENDHLTAQYTCLAFVEVSQSGKAGKTPGKRRKLDNGESASVQKFAALGNTRGKIVVWDLVAGQVVHRLQSDTACINDIVFSPNGQNIFACSTGKYVVEWNLETEQVSRKFVGDKHGVKRLCLSPDGTCLLTASLGIKLWDVATLERLKRFAGHHSQITAMAFAGADNQFVVSAGADRFVNVWNAKGDGGKQKTPITLASVSHAPTSVAAVSINDDTIRICVTSSTENAYVWQVSLGDALAKSGTKGALTPQKPDSIVTLAQSSDKILGMFLQDTSEGPASRGLVVANSSVAAKPAFHHASLIDSDDSETLLSSVRVGAGSEEGDVAPGVDALVLSPEQVKALMASRGAKTLGIADAAPTNMSNKSDSRVDDVLKNIDNRPLAERVQDMVDTLANAPIKESVQLDAGDDDEELAAKQAQVAQSNAMSSLSGVLEQALQGGDNNLMEMCLQTRSSNVIRNTIKGLSTNRVLQFLQLVVRKFEARPSRGGVLLQWIRAILEIHAAFLLTVPNLAEALNGLYQTIEARVITYKKLTKLSGRLQFVMSQMSNSVSLQSRAATLAALVPAKRERSVSADYGDESEHESDLGSSSAESDDEE